MKDVGNTGRQLNVAHFMPWSGVGGVEVATLRMAAVTNHTLRNVAFCLADAVELITAFGRMGIETVTYHAPEPSLRHGLRYFKDSLAVARLIREMRIDVVHFADEKAAYHNSLAALIAGTKIICHIRTRHSSLSLRQRLCLAPIHSFLFVSEDAKNSVAKYLPEERCRVIYDGVEPPSVNVSEQRAAVRLELDIPEGATVIGMVSRVAPVKDYFTLALAAADVIRVHPATLFLIVGDNSLVELNRRHYVEVVNKLDELHIRQSFRFTGHRTDVIPFVAAMDICVLCSHREGLPLSVLEAMAMSKPVVATAVGGIPEIIKPGLTGYLHDHQDAQGLSSAINSLIENPDRARQFGAAGYAEVSANYSMERFFDNISVAYYNVMKERFARIFAFRIARKAPFEKLDKFS